MPKVTFVSHDGKRREAEAPEGESVMRAAILNNIPGIDGDCGGQGACATCHVYVDAVWLDKCGSPNALEESMLGFTDAARPNSRLACQIELTKALDGLVVETPAAQH